MRRAFCFLKAVGGAERRRREEGEGGVEEGERAERFCKSMEVWLLLQPKL